MILNPFFFVLSSTEMALQDEVWTAKENETCISHCVSNSLAILHAQEMVLPDWRYGHPIATTYHGVTRLNLLCKRGGPT